ncbi:hypothetical protein [Mesorhizobium sp. LjRoot246]|uniref:hypothetical protein n=1 Tax=Mesorhizobium sp. LjRoot246 TaxID=3342294 RepID=UPI003F50037A
MVWSHWNAPIGTAFPAASSVRFRPDDAGGTVASLGIPELQREQEQFRHQAAMNWKSS